MSETEFIVFVDEKGKPTGEVGPKLASHTANTKRHLAFSCYVFRDDGKLLVTQRAHSKKVWPTIWTNSFCGHPGPGERMEDAITRRAQYELGIKVSDLKCVLPNYTYKTPPFNGIIENEFCPVFVAKTTSEIKPNPEEVDDFRWQTWGSLLAEVKDDPARFSYWLKDQSRLLQKIF